MSVYTNILCYSLIIYICSMYVVYFMHNIISISSFSSFHNSIICNPVCFDEKYFIFFLLVSGLVGFIVMFLLLDFYPLLIRVLIIFYHYQTLFRNQIDSTGNHFDIPYLWINSNFPNQLEKLPRIDSKTPSQLEKLPWINPNLSLMSPLLTLKP